MDSSPIQARISPIWLLLDVVGIALTGIGVGVNTGHPEILPAYLRFPGAGWMLIMIGVLLMLILVWQIRRRVREIRRRDARRLLELGAQSYQRKTR